MAARMKSHVDDLQVEIILGTYEQVLFGYKLSAVDDVATLEVSFTDKSHAASIRSLAISTHNVLASGGADESIFLFDLKRRKALAVLSQHVGTVKSIHFHKEFMISCDDEGQILLWKTSRREFECVRTLRGHKGGVVDFSIHPSGKLLLSIGQDKTLRAWNLIEGCKAFVTNHMVVHDFVSWSPMGDKYLLASDRKIDVCSVSTAGPILSIDLPGRIHALLFVNDRYFVAGCEGGYVCLINMEDGSTTHEIKLETPRIKALDVKMIEQNKYILGLTTSDGLVQLYLIQMEIEEISFELIVATKTALRPICVALSVSTPSTIASSKDKGVQGEFVEDKEPKPRKRKRSKKLKQSQAPIADNGNHVEKDIAEKSITKPTKKKAGGKKRKMAEVVTVSKDLPLEENRQSPEKTTKFRPKDSVKIAKSKAKQFKEKRSKSNSIPRKPVSTT